MKVLVFDTETTGLPINKPQVSDVNKWPHVIQLSHILYDTDNNVIIDCYDDIIKLDDNVNISEESIKIHGITRSLSKRKGIKRQSYFKQISRERSEGVELTDAEKNKGV